MAVAFGSASNKDDGGTASTTHVINKPTGTVDGDVLVCLISFENNGFITVTPPTGWTQVGSEAGTGDTTVTLDAYYRVASGEGASYTFTLNASVTAQLEMLRYTGAASGSEINASAMSTLSASSTSATAPSVTTTVANCMLVHLYGGRNGSTAGTWTPNTGYTEELDFGTTFYGSMGASDFTQTSSGASGTVTATTTQAQKNAAALIAIAPAAGGGTSISGTVGTSTWAGQGATVRTDTSMSASVGTSTWSGQAASIATNTDLQASVGISTWSGLTATVVISSGATAVNATVGISTWSGAAATIVAPGVTTSPYRVYNYGRARRIRG